MLFDVIRSLAYGQHVDVWAVLAQVLSVVFVILCILPLHEFAHGWVANKLGDPTAKLEGRLTLNPLASVDPMGALALILFGFGWAKPVPVNTRYFKHPKRDMAITALAGPVSNLLAALVGAVLVVVMEVFAPYNGVTQFIYNVLYYYVVVNISLAVFNLIPFRPWTAPALWRPSSAIGPCTPTTAIKTSLCLSCSCCCSPAPCPGPFPPPRTSSPG